MYEFSRPLGDAVRGSRKEQNLTQKQVAEMIDVDERTVLHIENYKANPKMEVLYPLIRALRIDATEIFYPEMNLAGPTAQHLQMLLADCSEQEAAALIPVVEAILSALRTNDGVMVE